MMEIDGTPMTAEDVSALALYNYGHFTSMRVEDQRVRGLSLHLDRLAHDCRVLFGADLDPQRVRHLVRRVASASPSPTMVRVTVFAPNLDLGHPGATAEPRVLVTTRPAAAADLPPLRLTSVGYERDLPEVKHVGLFGTVYHRRAAQLDGFDDVLFLDSRSRIVEGATWNIGFHDGQRVVWPQADWLPGVTMRLLTDVLRRIGMESTTATLNPSDLPRMQSAFVTNASVGIRAVQSIDEVNFPEGASIIKRLQDEYAAIPGELI